MSKFPFVIFILNLFLISSMNVNAVGFSVGGALTVEAETGFDAKNRVIENQEKGITEEERLSITWAINPAPPFFIFEGKYRAQGICDALVKQLKPIMSDVKHETVVMPQSRVNLHTEENENLCFPCVIQREHNTTWRFSNATTLYPPLGIIALPKTIEPFLNENGRVSLKALVRSNKLTFAQPISRKYPDALQVLVDSLKQTPRYAPIAGTEATTRVLRQLEYGRVDFTLEYPSILKYFTLTEGDSKLQFYYTSELGEEKIPGAVGCTNNAWGKEAIDRINAALDDVVNSPVYRASQEFWQN